MSVNVTEKLKIFLGNKSNFSSVGNHTNDIYNQLSSIPSFLIYIVVLTFAIVGNGLVCWTVKVNQRMHDITNYLLVNLAVSDLLLAVSSIFQVVDFVVKNLDIGRYTNLN